MHQRQQQGQLTAASLPGTTIGFVRLKDVVSSRKCRVFDTPGVLHRHQFTSTFSPLASDEVAMLLTRRTLRPRTFRAAVGSTVAVGGLVRVDVLESPQSTVYLTLWASDRVTHHYGKTQGAHERQLRG